MTGEERDTVTQVLQLVVTVDKNLESCLDHEEWRQEIMYAVNYKAGEANPEKAKESGFLIQVGITPLPPPCGDRKICCAHCPVVEGLEEVADPKLCQHQCNPLRDGDVSWDDPEVCAFLQDDGKTCSTGD